MKRAVLEGIEKSISFNRVIHLKARRFRARLCASHGDFGAAAALLIGRSVFSDCREFSDVVRFSVHCFLVGPLVVYVPFVTWYLSKCEALCLRFVTRLGLAFSGCLGILRFRVLRRVRLPCACS